MGNKHVLPVEPDIFDIIRTVRESPITNCTVEGIQKNTVVLTLRYLKNNNMLAMVDSKIEENCPFKYERFGDECCESDCMKTGTVLCERKNNG